ncbi:hypothetical protein PILCRDRAFT_5867 [Piloderma croceum F 1598]|uniref:Uncharacterized protein n=1 Tax=Piloderma croceum (strain F 1598) TaxID=765440 RepID=A0A0C3FLB5_PILCF|nr:hypothetical protein PILCRDRAFT_5867 [Piloderma croceum F 1598]
MIDLPHPLQVAIPDPLFLERLQAFLEKTLNEIQSFSERENKPFDETRRYVAEWHCAYLFGPESQSESRVSKGDRRKYIHSVLSETSRTFESLHSLSGNHSFFLTVDPADAENNGFLGGTVLGREFWRGIRGGGHAGAKNFRLHCLKKAEMVNTITALQNSNSTDGETLTLGAAATALSKRGPASSLKAEVYANVRDALRTASGIRTAEMKWSNHDRLSTHDVRLVGWPPSIPQQNPSAMTAAQNKLLLEALADGSMRFEKIGAHKQLVEEVGQDDVGIRGAVPSQQTADISWAYDRGQQSGTGTPQTRPGPSNETPPRWQREQAGPSRQAQQHRHQYMRQISPSLSDDIADPASYLLAYDMECINDLTPEFSPLNLQPSVGMDMLDISSNSQESEGVAARHELLNPEDRSSKKRRLDEGDG